MRGAHLFCALRFDLNINVHRLANSRKRFSRRGKHQLEFASVDRGSRDGPARTACFVNRRQQFYLKGDRFRHAVHRKIAEDLATLRTSPLHAPALERHLRKSCYVEELPAAEVVVAFLDARIDTAHINLRRDRGILRMFPIDFDLAAEVPEFAVRGAQELMHAESNG